MPGRVEQREQRSEIRKNNRKYEQNLRALSGVSTAKQDKAEAAQGRDTSGLKAMDPKMGRVANPRGGK